jgi:hypothetical protein
MLAATVYSFSDAASLRQSTTHTVTTLAFTEGLSLLGTEAAVGSTMIKTPVPTITPER